MDDLRLYIRGVLNEAPVDVKSSNMYKAFIEPFVDVGKTASAGVQKLAGNIHSAIEIALGGMASLMIPGIRYNYEAATVRNKARMQQIRKKYEEVFKRTEGALQGDAPFVAFALNPAAGLAYIAGKKSASTVLDLVDILAGGNHYVLRRTNIIRDDLGLDVQRRVGAPEGSITSINKLLNDPEIARAINDSKISHGLKHDVKDMILQSYKEMEEPARMILNTDTKSKGSGIMGSADVKKAKSNARDVLKKIEKHRKDLGSI